MIYTFLYYLDTKNDKEDSEGGGNMEVDIGKWIVHVWVNVLNNIIIVSTQGWHTT